jgi:hypothetical protein
VYPIPALIINIHLYILCCFLSSFFIGVFHSTSYHLYSSLCYFPVLIVNKHLYDPFRFFSSLFIGMPHFTSYHQHTTVCSIPLLIVIIPLYVPFHICHCLLSSSSVGFAARRRREIAFGKVFF